MYSRVVRPSICVRLSSSASTCACSSPKRVGWRGFAIVTMAFNGFWTEGLMAGAGDHSSVKDQLKRFRELIDADATARNWQGSWPPRARRSSTSRLSRNSRRRSAASRRTLPASSCCRSKAAWRQISLVPQTGSAPREPPQVFAQRRNAPSLSPTGSTPTSVSQLKHPPTVLSETRSVVVIDRLCGKTL